MADKASNSFLCYTNVHFLKLCLPYFLKIKRYSDGLAPAKLATISRLKVKPIALTLVGS